MRIVTVQGQGTALMEVTLAQTGRALRPEVKLGSGPEVRGKDIWSRTGLGAKVRVNIHFSSSDIIIMKTLIIVIIIVVCRASS